MENISIIILLLFGVAFLGVLSNRFKFPFPIALVLSGLLISLIPGLPVVELKPGGSSDYRTLFIIPVRCHIYQ
jgi:hypothetical protein